MEDLILDLAVEASLKRYIRDQLEIRPQLLQPSFGRRPLLDRALRPCLEHGSTARRINLEVVHILLTLGADPNQSFTITALGLKRTTVWARFLQHLYWTNGSWSAKHISGFQGDLAATRRMIESGAAADIRPWRILPWETSFGCHMLTPSDIFHKVYSPADALSLDRLLSKHRPWAFWRLCSIVKRTFILWIDRCIILAQWIGQPPTLGSILRTLMSIFFNDLTGVILPMVMIPVALHCIVLCLRPISYILSCLLDLRIVSLVIASLILTDWIPIIETLTRLTVYFPVKYRVK